MLLCTVGYVSAVRTLRTEESWIAIRKQLEIARQIQLSILPREMPHTTALQVAAGYVPITAVAGDFYDFLIVDRDRVGILVADVSGHGVPAALIASMVKIAIAAQMPHADDPAQVLSGMNRTLCGKLQGQFVTAAYVFIDSAARKMRYAAAGHPAMLWYRCTDQSIRTVEENGLTQGFMDHRLLTHSRSGKSARVTGSCCTRMGPSKPPMKQMNSLAQETAEKDGRGTNIGRGGLRYVVVA